MKIKKKRFIFVILIIAVCFSFVFSESGFGKARAEDAKVYYISSSEGDDSADGLSPETAWKSFDNVNMKKLSAGERVLLRRGDTWNQRLEILGQGKQDAWIEISAYGEGEKPCISLNNGDDDIAVLVKDFYADKDGNAVASPIQYIKINNLKIENTRLGIFIRIYQTENAGKEAPALQSHHVEITDCEFENITSGILPELNEAVDAEESKYDEYSPIASAAIYKIYNAKIDALHGSPKGNLPKVVAGKYSETGGGGYEYVFPCAVLLGGRKSTVTDENADKAASAFQYFRVCRLELRDCIAGVMAWFYHWNGQTQTDKFRSVVQYINIEDILATGVAPSALGMEGCDGGAFLDGDKMTPNKDGWGRIANIRVIRGSLDESQKVPMGSTDVIIEKSKNFLIEECEFLGMTNHDNCDGVGFDFEGNDSNIELKNCVFAYNDGAAILIMDNGSGGHSNLFIRNNLIYGNLQNAYHQYNNRNNAIDRFCIAFHNRNNENVVIENNIVRYQRQTTSKADVDFIGSAEESDSTYILKNNDLGCYESGAGFKEFTAYYESVTTSGGKIVLKNIGLHSKRYNAMKISVRGETAYKGWILGRSPGGNSSAEPVGFESADGYVDIASLPGINWNIPFADIEITLDGVKDGKAATVEFIPNTTASFVAVQGRGDQVEVIVNGDSGSVFRTNLSAEDFRLCNLITRKKILDAKRISFTRAVLTLDGELTTNEKNYLNIRFADILPSAWETNVRNAFSAIDVNGVRNEKSIFFAQRLELLSKPKDRYAQGEEFDLTGARAMVTFADGTQKEVVGNGLSVFGFDSSQTGNSVVGIGYGNAVAYINVTVENRAGNSSESGNSGSADNENERSGGCGSSAASIVGLFVLSLAAVMFLRERS